MQPSLEKLLLALEKGDVDVFLYILLCPLGRCAGVSNDTVTGSFFKVIEEGAEAGLKTVFLILSQHTQNRNSSREKARCSCVMNLCITA